MEKKETNYEEALLQLEEIAQKMESGEFEIDELTVQLKKAQKLIKLCKDKLQGTETEIQKILGQENK
jgi:exodeoxyribonuclease VII small subunit